MLTLPVGYNLREGADVAAAHAYLARSYWAEGIPLETVERALTNSFAVSARQGDAQVGMARVVTDHATFAYLADVYVLEDHRGQGLSKAMVTWLHGHPDLRGLRRWMLNTRDAHSLYGGLGWAPLAKPDRVMERVLPVTYG